MIFSHSATYSPLPLHAILTPPRSMKECEMSAFGYLLTLTLLALIFTS